MVWKGSCLEMPEKVNPNLAIQVLASITGKEIPEVIAKTFAVETSFLATRVGSFSKFLGNKERSPQIEFRNLFYLAQKL